ncbi:MAG TPA: hypothetical protein VFC37_02785 [Terracidiphilus sp.]|nr:hypothetical protein [Terracidiphilus sp.]
MLRHIAKELRGQLERSSGQLPHKKRLLQLAEEMLRLVSVYNQQDEDRDDFERKYNAGEVELP